MLAPNTVKAHLTKEQINILMHLVDHRIDSIEYKADGRKLEGHTAILHTELLAIRKELEHAGT